MIVSGFRFDDEPASTGVRRFALHGELDAHAAEELQAALERQLGEDDRVVHLVCERLDFIDSVGLRVLVEVDRRLRADGRRLVLEKPTRPVRHVLQLADLDQHFEIVS